MVLQGETLPTVDDIMQIGSRVTILYCTGTSVPQQCALLDIMIDVIAVVERTHASPSCAEEVIFLQICFVCRCISGWCCKEE